MGNHGFDGGQTRQDHEEETEIPIEADEQLSEEELREKMKEAGFHMSADELHKELAAAKEHDHESHLQSINAIAETIGAHIDSKKSLIGAREISITNIDLAEKKPVAEQRARITITDAGGGKYFVDVQQTEEGSVRDLYLPPSLNPIREEILSIFNQMKKYGKLSPHSVE